MEEFAANIEARLEEYRLAKEHAQHMQSCTPPRAVTPIRVEPLKLPLISTPQALKIEVGFSALASSLVRDTVSSKPVFMQPAEEPHFLRDIKWKKNAGSHKDPAIATAARATKLSRDMIQCFSTNKHTNSSPILLRSASADVSRFSPGRPLTLGSPGNPNNSNKYINKALRPSDAVSDKHPNKQRNRSASPNQPLAGVHFRNASNASVDAAPDNPSVLSGTTSTTPGHHSPSAAGEVARLTATSYSLQSEITSPDREGAAVAAEARRQRKTRAVL
jgi:hypothetical protein